MQHKIAQQAELGGGQLNVGTVTHHTLAALIELQPGGVECRLVGLAVGAAQQCLNPQVQFFRVKGFGQVVIGPGLEAFDALGPGIARGQHQYRRSQARGTPAAEHFKPWQSRQPQIEDDQIIGFGAALMHRIAAIGQPVHGITLAIEAGQQLVGQRHVVFHQKQTHRSIFLVFE
ncbi:hypothetical protein D3C78_746140 [compost metagenome]